MKPKQVNWQIIPRVSTGVEPYDILDDLTTTFHDDIKGVVIVLMWRHNAKIDADNYLELSSISKTPDKHRELQEHDFIIGLNKEIWDMLDIDQKKIVIDAQLQRIAVAEDKDGEPREDDRSRVVYRLRRDEISTPEVQRRRHGAALGDVVDHIVSRIGTEVEKKEEPEKEEPEPETGLSDATGELDTEEEGYLASLTD